MFSEKAKKHADACRFCFMCRHLCPVGQKTGKENNTPRAKGLLISLVNRGQEYTSDMASDIYECCLCEACSNDCATGYEPSVFVREARTMALVNDLVPPRVAKVIDDVMGTGNLFGQDPKDKMDALAGDIEGLPPRAGTVLHIGETAAYRRPEMAKAVIRLLKKAGVDFTVIRDEKPSGTELGDLIGFVDDVRRLACATAEQIKAAGAETLVVLDPSDARMFKHQYTEWDCAPAPEIVTATSFIAGLIADGKLKPKKMDMTVTYHDPCRLARDLDEYEPAREIIAAMGLSLHEMFLNRRMTKCCGGEVLRSHAPHLTELTGEGRWADASRTGAGTVLTACPGCLDVLGKNIPDGMEIVDLFALLAEACGA